MKLRDGRRFAHVNSQPTLRVCVECGAYWQASNDDNDAGAWPGTIRHVGPHNPNYREYKRSSGWPRMC